MDQGAARDPTSFEWVFRARMIRWASWLIVAFGIVVVWRYLQLGLIWLAAVDVLTMAVLIGNLFLLRRGALTFCGHVATCAMLAVLVIDVGATGGFYDPNFAWLYVVPVLGGLLIPGRAILGYGVLVLGVMVGFWGLDEYGPGVLDIVPPEEHAAQSLFNVLTSAGAIVAIVAAFGHERSRSARALSEAIVEAERASRSKSEFLANTSHELRTPLNAIIGFSELLIEEADERGEPTAELAHVRSAGGTLLRLINDLLDLSKIEAGKLELDPIPTRLAPLLEEAAASLDPLVRRRGNRLVVELAPDLGVAVLDGPRLVQIVTNLVSNAAKFTCDGRVGLVASRHGDTVRVEVTDTGIGIPPDKQGMVFDTFAQADSATSRNHGGTGLGLPISRRLARLMGGDVTLESAVGVGSRFSVTVRDRTCGAGGGLPRR